MSNTEPEEDYGWRNPYLSRLAAMLENAAFTQRFGCTGFRLEPAYGDCAHFHRGIDFVVRGGMGANVYAPASGVVVGTSVRGLGNSVEILAPNGFRYIIGHLQSAAARPGDRVLAGQLIGAQGSTGASTGAHVHLEIHDPAGRPINPAPVEWNNWKRAWYTLFHSLGAGAGYNPGQSVPVPPDPMTPGWGGTVVPVPLPGGEPATWEYANGVEPTGPPDAPGEVPAYNYDPAATSFTGASLGGMLGFLTDSGGPIGAALAAAATGGEPVIGTATGSSSFDCSRAALVLAVAGAGVVLVIIGLLAIAREEPVQQNIVQPVIAPASDAIQAGASVAGKVAKS